jgi:hypothetical protein
MFGVDPVKMAINAAKEKLVEFENSKEGKKLLAELEALEKDLAELSVIAGYMKAINTTEVEAFVVKNFPSLAPQVKHIVDGVEKALTLIPKAQALFDEIEALIKAVK